MQNLVFKFRIETISKPFFLLCDTSWNVDVTHVYKSLYKGTSIIHFTIDIILLLKDDDGSILLKK